MELKTQAHDLVRATERVWDFYFELFGQRQSRVRRVAGRLRPDHARLLSARVHAPRQRRAASPRRHRSCYMRTGFSPATFRRGIPLRRLGRQLNPFPLVQLPYHRMVNPWTMGAILHEVSHNLQNELRARAGRPVVDRTQARAAGVPDAGGRGVGALEPRDLRRHGRLHARWRGLRRAR